MQTGCVLAYFSTRALQGEPGCCLSRWRRVTELRRHFGRQERWFRCVCVCVCARSAVLWVQVVNQATACPFSPLRHPDILFSTCGFSSTCFPPVYTRPPLVPADGNQRSRTDSCTDLWFHSFVLKLDRNKEEVRGKPAGGPEGSRQKVER